MKIYRIILPLLMCLVAAWPLGAAVFDPVTALERSKALVEEEKYDQALNELLYSLLEAKGFERARVLAARSNILAHRGEVLAALDQMDLAVAGAKDDPCIRLERAQMYYSFGEPGLARIDAFAALGMGCKDTRLTALIARLYFTEGDLLNAVDWFYRLFYHPEYRVDALGSLGIAYSVMGYPETAAVYYGLALELFPESPLLHAALADTYISMGRFEKAVEHYEKCFEVSDPPDPAALNNYGYTLVLKGEKDRARAVFEELNKEAPSVFSVCNMLELALLDEDREAASIYGAMCMREFAASPRVLERERFYFLALRRALNTMVEDPMALHPLTQRDLAAQHLEHGERTQALAALILGVVLDPLNAEINFEAGRMMIKFGELSRGATYLNLASALAGPHSDIAARARVIINTEAMLMFGGAAAPVE